MYFDDAFDNCQSDTSTFALHIQFVEDAKYPVMEAGVYANAIVANEEYWCATLFKSLTNFDLWLWLFIHELG